MNYIELIGPPGVGKTTLINLLVKTREKNDIWKTYQEGVYDIVDGLEWSQLATRKSKLLYLLNKSNVWDYKKQGICNIIIEELTSIIPVSIQKKYEYLIDAQIKAMQFLDPHISPINKSSILNWHYQMLNRIFILESFGYSKTVVFDEGPIKTHYGLHQIDPSQITPNTLPKAVIYCTISVDENLRRVKIRKRKTGRTSTIHNTLNNKELEYLVGFTHEIAEKNVTFLNNLGIPTLEVDLTSPLDNSDLTRLNQFIATYSAASDQLFYEPKVVL